MGDNTLKVVIDTAEQRVARDRIVTLADGRHWDITKSTAFIDGVTRTGMLMPLCLTPQWATTTTGLYARLTKKDYTFTTSPFVLPGTPPPYPDGTPTDQSKWVDFHHDYQGNVYLMSQGVNDRAVTNKKWPRNRPFRVSWFSYNSGNTAAIQFECGWLADDAFIGLLIWTDGKCELYKNGTQVGEGNIFEHKVTTQTVYGKETATLHRKKASKGDARQLAGQTVDLMLIPCRRRDLLIISNQGGGFRFTFEDLDADNDDNTITPDNARFFWQVRTGQVKVQCAPLNFLGSGVLISETRTLRLTPEADEEAEFAAYADQPGYGASDYETSLLEEDAVTAFVPDGEKNQVRVKVALTGDGESTEFVYGASAIFPARIASTDEFSAIDITQFVVSAELSVPENPSDVEFKIACKAPEYMEQTAGVAFARTQANRPMRAGFGDIAIITARSKSPNWRESTSDPARRLMLDFRDQVKALEDYRIQDAIPVDGQELAEGMKHFARLPGCFSEDQLDIPDFGLNLPTVGQSSEGEYALLPDVGDKALDWFEKLHRTFAPHTNWCVKPTVAGPVLHVRTLDDLESAPSQRTLYARVEDAINAGIAREFAPYYVYRTMAPTRIECEANDIWVTGRDSRTGKPFQTRYADPASQDPTLAPADRPANWVGEPRYYAFADEAINTEELASWVAWTLARRLTVVRDIYAIDSFFLFRDDDAPIWKGDIVTLDGIGDVRITAFSGHFQNEYEGASAAQDMIWRPFHYTGEFVRGPQI